MIVKSQKLIFRSPPQVKSNLENVSVKPPAVRARLRNWKPQFLKAFASCGIISMAAKSVGVDRTAVFRARQQSPKFAAQFAEALQEANDVLEAHALQLCTVGASDPIWMRDENNKPVMVFDRKRKSERILELMLRARMPEKYRQNVTQELTGPNGSPLALPISPVSVQFVIPNNFRADPAHSQVADTQSVVVDMPKNGLENAE